MSAARQPSPVAKTVRSWDEIVCQLALLDPDAPPALRGLLRWLVNHPGQEFPDLGGFSGGIPSDDTSAGDIASPEDVLGADDHPHSVAALANQAPPPGYRPTPTLDELRESFERNLYFLSAEEVRTVHVALTSGKGLLVTGPPGVGKTALAAQLAVAMGLNPEAAGHYEETFCTSFIATETAIYKWNDARRLIDQQLISSLVAHRAGAERVFRQMASRTYDLRYLTVHSLLRACVLPFRTVRLIDEVDKAQPWFDNELLTLIGSHQYSIPEIGRPIGRSRPDPEHGPLYVLTSNEDREVSAPLAGRCVPLFLAYPTEGLEARILHAKTPLDKADCGRVAAFFRKIREDANLRLRMPPGTREVLDTAAALVRIGAEVTDKALLELNCLWVKQRTDRETIVRRHSNGGVWHTTI